METTLTMPQGGLVPVTTFVSGIDRDGTMIEYGTRWYVYRANAAIVRGAGVIFVVPTATVPLSVTPMAAASAFNLFVGIAMDAIASGKYGRIAVGGHALAFMNAQTSAFGEYLIRPTGTAGEMVRTATAPIATDVLGTFYGTVLGVKDATSLLAPVYLNTI